ncbi:hypothetical protein HAZT_HAZT000109 [Hyalella azteca]|nr:hypothetical protein HAZT_HAZT000109 [Hyalella azteca]
MDLDTARDAEATEAAEERESLDVALEQEPIADEDVAEVNDESNLGLKFPLARVKKIMKADPDLHLASQDAVFLIAKATELFVEVVAESAHHHTMKANRKTISGRDVMSCIELIDALAFLDGALND